ncbi:hypothetical protein ABPG72_013391 [Tetrahymena utriculariae]
MKQNQLITFIVIILFLAQVKLQQQQTIENCVNYFQVRDIYDIYDLSIKPQRLCIECQKGYIVSKSFKQCIDIRHSQSNQQLIYCRRMVFYGFCAEAIENMVIFSNQTYSLLDLITKDIFRTFCALYDSEIKDCLEFQSGFIRINNTQLGAFIGERLKNPEQILPISNSERIVCSKDFEFKQTRFVKGCLLNQTKSQLTKNQIAFCQQMMNDIQCKLCQNGYALRYDKQKCQLVIKNCQEYTKIQNQIVCTQCLPSYSLFQQSCVFMNGCQVKSRKSPIKYMACSSIFELIDGKCVNQKSKKTSYYIDYQIQNKLSDFKKYFLRDIQKNEKLEEIYFGQNEIQLEINAQREYCSVKYQKECLKCNDLSFYFDQKQKKCLQRIRSLYCSNKIYNQDDCLNLECQENYQINKEQFNLLDLRDKLTIQYIEEYLIFAFFDSDYLMNDFEIQQFYLSYQSKGVSLQNKVYCIAKQETDIQNCIKFDLQNNLCQKCQSGYYLTNHIEFGHSKQQCLSKLNMLNLDHCVSYGLEENICYECQEGYYFNSKAMQCFKQITNCYIHTLQNECLLCQEGYILIQSNYCSINFIEQSNLVIIENQLQIQQFDSHCVLFQNKTCILCAEGFVLDKTSNFQCQLDSLFPDCKAIDQINYDQSEMLTGLVYTRDYKACKECRQGYTIEKGFCFKISQLSFQGYDINHQNSIANCLIYDDQNICLQCDYEYQFSQKNNQCIKIHQIDRLLFEQQLEPIQDGCQLYHDDKKCKICKNNLFLMSDFNCYEECPQDYISNCEFLVEEDSNFCVKKCKDNYFLSEQKCLKNCSFFYKTLNKQNFCITECQEMFRYEDDLKRCSEECDEGYARMIDQKLCKKCSINQCKTSSINDLNVCIECKIPYTNYQGQCKYQCLNKFILEDKDKCDNNINIEYCAKQLYERCQVCHNTFELTGDFVCKCPEGTFFNQEVNECQQCGLGCLQCDQKLGCLKCALPYIQIMLFDKFECTNYCGPGLFHQVLQNICQKYEKNCLKCINKNKCNECLPTFQLQNSKNKDQCICPSNYVINEESNTCEFQCKDGYKPDTLKCCEIQNCSQCNKNHQICEKCNKNYPYLFQNSCRKECPEGYYQDIAALQCNKCSPLCSQCEKNQSTCLSCSLPQAKIEDSSCKYKKNQVFFQSDCFIECPKYTALSSDQMVCEEYCTDSSYPVFDELGRFERCEFDLGQPDSKFCYQNLSSLNRLVDFSISEEKKQQNKKSFILVVSISNTPKDCYIFKLRGNDENDSFHIIQRLKDQKSQDLFNLNFCLESEIQINDIQENNLVECNTFYCIFYFELRISFEYQSVTVEGIQDFSILLNGEYNAVIPQSIPQDQLLQSVLQIQCGSSNYCNQKEIKTEINHPISINIEATFKFRVKDDNLLTIYPLSLYILEKNSQKLPIDTFYFDNSIPSSIKLSIYFQHQAKGQLIIILRAYNQKYFLKGLEFFSYENNYLKFLVQKIDIEILEAKNIKDEKEDEKQQKNQNSQSEQKEFDFTYQIFILFNTFISIIFLVYVLIYCFRKIISKRNQSQHIELVEILYITEEKSTSQQQQVQIELS